MLSLNIDNEIKEVSKDKILHALNINNQFDKARLNECEKENDIKGIEIFKEGIKNTTRIFNKVIKDKKLKENEKSIIRDCIEIFSDQLEQLGV